MAFLQSAPPRQPVFRAPAVVLWLIGILAGLHLGRVLLPPDRALDLVFEYGLVPARYSRAFLESHMADPGTVWERFLPFVSYMGLHNDLAHLLVNSFFLLAFGPPVARRLGAPLFLIFFFVCGVLAAGAYLAFNWGSPVPVVGASGAISGLMAAAIRMMPGTAPWVRPGEAPLMPLFSTRVLLFSGLLILANVMVGLTGWGVGPDAGAIAWQAHLGGFVAGLLLCGPVDNLRPRVTGLPVDR